MFSTIHQLVGRIQKTRPLVLNITNQVTMDFIANGLLSLGASPIMSQAKEELYDLIGIANAVVINIGTLNPEFISLCEQACKIAKQLNKPLILDPVGAGASTYRTKSCMSLLEQFQFDIIRGNASEVMALSVGYASTKGVDANIHSLEAVSAAQAFSTAKQSVVAISGETDILIQNEKTEQFQRGSAYMPTITGSGCLLTAVLGAFVAVESDCFTAASAALLFYSVCGELAAKKADGPGSFKMHFLDALSQLPVRAHYE